VVTADLDRLNADISQEAERCMDEVRAALR
jgi:hypothetical protein